MKNTINDELATILLLSYNQEEYIEEAIESMLAQTYNPLEIVISDDCSSDETFERATAKIQGYMGPHKIILRRNEKNLGLAKHFSLLIGIASGEVIIAAAGDDISLPHRTLLSMNAFRNNSKLTFYEGALEEFGENLSSKNYYAYNNSKSFELTNLTKNLRTRLVGAGRAYKKKALLSFPELNHNCPSEDSTNVLRCLIAGSGLYEPVICVKHRKHKYNLSNPGRISSKDLVALKEQYLADIEFSIKLKMRNLKELKMLRKSIKYQTECRIRKAEIQESSGFVKNIILKFHLVVFKLMNYFFNV